MALSKQLFNRFSNIISKKRFFLVTSLNYKQQEYPLQPASDYVRYATMWLCADEIKRKGVGGNIAELGVYKGDSAKRLNELFPDKTLYLFDTFEGFHEKDIAVENQRNFSDGTQNFSGTSVNLVLGKMNYPQKCIIKKGYFPETAAGVNDTFCLVSLDTDLYAPIYDGLNFFYPRLEKGGYILVHDFNNDNYKGARQAVLTFCNENNVGYVPIPDSGGSVVLTK